MRIAPLTITILFFLNAHTIAAPTVPVFPMQNGGISLRATAANIGQGRQPVWLHVYCVPKGHIDGTAGPVTREDIGPGATIKTSPFFLDIFDTVGGKLRRLNSVPFTSAGDCNQLEVRWLHPRRRRDPVILLRFGVGDVGDWMVVPLVHGLRGTPKLQYFGFSADAEGSCTSYFDRTDRRGVLMIVEECRDEKRHTVTRYRWNGREFK